MKPEKMPFRSSSVIGETLSPRGGGDSDVIVLLAVVAGMSRCPNVFTPKGRDCQQMSHIR